jgi:hypothetical protein
MGLGGPGAGEFHFLTQQVPKNAHDQIRKVGRGIVRGTMNLAGWPDGTGGGGLFLVMAAILVSRFAMPRLRTQGHTARWGRGLVVERQLHLTQLP